MSKGGFEKNPLLYRGNKKIYGILETGVSCLIGGSKTGIIEKV